MGRRQEIIDLARELVQTRGFDSFSYADLSSRLGIRKASIHHYFPTKQDLGVALVRATREWQASYFEELDNRGVGPWEKIQRFIRLAAGTVGMPAGRICALFSLQSAFNVIGEDMRTELAEADRLELEFLRQALEEARAQGEITFGGDPERRAMHLLAAIKGATQYARVHGRSYFELVIADLEADLGGGR